MLDIAVQNSFTLYSLKNGYSISRTDAIDKMTHYMLKIAADYRFQKQSKNNFSGLSKIVLSTFSYLGIDLNKKKEKNEKDMDKCAYILCSNKRLQKSKCESCQNFFCRLHSQCKCLTCLSKEN